jgi:hypothetical protein
MTEKPETKPRPDIWRACEDAIADRLDAPELAALVHLMRNSSPPWTEARHAIRQLGRAIDEHVAEQRAEKSFAARHDEAGDEADGVVRYLTPDNKELN